MILAERGGVVLKGRRMVVAGLSEGMSFGGGVRADGVLNVSIFPW